MVVLALLPFFALHTQDGAREEECYRAVAFAALPRQEVGEAQVAALDFLREAYEALLLPCDGELGAERTKEGIGGVLHARLVQPAAAPRLSEVNRRLEVERIDHIAHMDPPPFCSSSAIPCNRSCGMAFSAWIVKCFTWKSRSNTLPYPREPCPPR